MLISGPVLAAGAGGVRRRRAVSLRSPLPPAQSPPRFARRHEITSQHLFAWRKAARQGRLVLPEDAMPLFVPVVTAPPEAGAKSSAAGSIAIEIAGMVVLAQPGVDLVFLRDVLRAVKAAT